MPENRVAGSGERGSTSLRAVRSELRPQYRDGQMSSTLDRLKQKPSSVQHTPKKAAGPTSAPSRPVTETKSEQPTVARQQSKQIQSYEQHTWNVAFKPKAQMLQESREVIDNIIEEGEVLQAKEELTKERELVDEWRSILEQENDELRRTKKMRPRGLVERDVERLEKEKTEFATRCEERYVVRTKALQDNNRAMHKLIQSSKTTGKPSKDSWKEIAGQLQATSVAREAAEDRVVALEREVEKLRETNEGLRLKDAAAAARFKARHDSSAKPTATKRVAPRDDAEADAEAQSAHKRSRTKYPSSFL